MMSSAAPPPETLVPATLLWAQALEITLDTSENRLAGIYHEEDGVASTPHGHIQRYPSIKCDNIVVFTRQLARLLRTELNHCSGNTRR